MGDTKPRVHLIVEVSFQRTGQHSFEIEVKTKIRPTSSRSIPVLPKEEKMCNFHQYNHTCGHKSMPRAKDCKQAVFAQRPCKYGDISESVKVEYACPECYEEPDPRFLRKQHEEEQRALKKGKRVVRF